MLKRQGVGNLTVFWILMISALVVIGARVIAPFQVGKDQGSQLEAAIHLADGKGLTTTAVAPSSYDITETPDAKYLTWWPPGFSLIVATFLAMGLPLLLTLKLIYASISLIGWIGWGIIISHFVTDPVAFRGRTYPTHLALAALLPVFFTLSWSGSDIILWAGIPFVFLALVKQVRPDASYKSVVLAGLLFGLLYAIRYASLFLALAALLILLQVQFPNYGRSVKRFSVFLLSALVLIIPTYLYTKFYASGVSGITDHASVDSIIYTPGMLIKWIFLKLPMTWNLVLGFPLLDQILLRINSYWLFYVTGIMSAAILLALPLILIKSKNRTRHRFQDDMGLSLSLLLISLPVFLIVVDTIVRSGLLGIRRYYDPVVFCGVLIFYQLATSRMTWQIVARASLCVVIAFLAYLCLYSPAQGFTKERNGLLVRTVLGYLPPNNTRYNATSYNVSYPSYTMFSSRESSKQKMKELYKADPDAIFFVEEYGYFAYDCFSNGDPTPGTRVRVLPNRDYWNQAYTPRPVKVYLVVNQKTDLDFLRGNDRQLIFSDPIEKTKILGAQLLPGHKLIADQTAPPLEVEGWTLSVDTN